MRSANSTGPSMLAGSLTRSRARNTPSATALRAAKALAAASGLAHWMTSLRRPSRGSLLGAVLGLAGAVLLEGVAAQQRAERQIGREHLRARLAEVGGLGDDAGRLALARADLGEGIAAEQQPVQLLRRLAGADQQRRCVSMPAGPGSRSALLALPVKSAARGGLRQRALHALVDAARGGCREPVLAGQQHQRAGGRRRQRSELDLERVCRHWNRVPSAVVQRELATTSVRQPMTQRRKAPQMSAGALR